VKLELRGITKRFGSLVANDAIDLVVRPGEIHALLGENGAGKSTLMNVLYGLYQPDSGEILIDDKRVNFKGPRDAMVAGIGMVHQHFMLIPVFTVAENVELGHEQTRRLGFLDHRKARRLVAEVSARYGLDVPPDARVADLPVGVQQRVEIVKALIRNANVLILDEPTAVLTPQETDDLMEVMRALRDGGTSIVFITHKLREVRAVADRITVLRRGTVVGEALPTSSSAELASMMVGRPVLLTVDKGVAAPGESVLQVDSLCVVDERGQVVVDDVSFSVRSGEIYAVAGVQGNGQSELTESLIGLTRPTSGRILIDGDDVARESIDEILARGVGYVPEDRSHDGLVGGFTIAENLVLDTFDQAPFAKRMSLDLKVIDDHAQERVQEFDIRTSSIHAKASTLSGGNQQKVALARLLHHDVDILLLDEPTRGIDVRSRAEVHQAIDELARRGKAIVLISSYWPELLELCDRIVVMCRGKLGPVRPVDEWDEHSLLLEATGSV